MFAAASNMRVYNSHGVEDEGLTPRETRRVPMI